MKPSTTTPTEDDETYAPVDKRLKSTGFLPVTAGSNPAGSTSPLQSYLAHLAHLVLIAWGEAVAPSGGRQKHNR